MIMRKKTTTDQVLNEVTGRLSSDITALAQKKNSTVSVFRNAASDLEQINQDLREYANRFESLAEFAKSQKEEADRMIADNETVRSKMLEIIGE